jgi:hypothetical protein
VLARFAEAWDYRWERNGSLVRLHKRHTDNEDRPSFSAEELAAVVGEILPLIEPFWVEWRDGVPPERRFALSFTPEQALALHGRPIPVTALSPLQRKLLEEFGVSRFLASAISPLRTLRAILMRPEAVRFAWKEPDGRARQRMLQLFYADPKRPEASTFLQPVLADARMRERPRIPGSPRRESAPVPPPPIPPSSRRLPFRVTIDRQDVFVEEILDELLKQVSVTVSATAYFRARRVSVHVRQVEAGALLDALGAVFGWQWDASRAGQVRVTRPTYPRPAWAQMDAVLWGMLPKPLRAYLEPNPEDPDRPSLYDRCDSGALQARRTLLDAVPENLPRELRFTEMAPPMQQRFRDWLTYDLLARAFRWSTGLAPPWLTNPERTTLTVYASPAIVASSPEAAALVGGVAGQQAGPGGVAFITVSLVGPGADGRTLRGSCSVDIRKHVR